MYKVSPSGGVTRHSPLARDPSATDQMLEMTWAQFAGSLRGADKGAAMQALSPTAQAKYGPVFDALLPDLPAIVPTWSAPTAGKLADAFAEFGINRTIGGVKRIFLIYFMLDEDGVWRLEAM